ncbi:hypothetical protein Nmel_005375 [Mimus melanotis]
MGSSSSSFNMNAKLKLWSVISVVESFQGNCLE